MTDNENSVFFNKDVLVGISSGAFDPQTRKGGLSYLRSYFEQETTYVYPHLTAIITVDEGEVRGITWDDACVFCGTGECKENTYDYNGNLQSHSSAGQPTKGCWELQDGCNELESKGDNKCDLTIYVVWTGTDANGVAFQSSAFRFSQFPVQDIQQRLSHILPINNNDRRLPEAKTVTMDGLLN